MTYAKDLLKGKVAVVTGGGTGLGKATALAMAEHGADVVLASRDGERLAVSAAEIAKKTGRKAIGVACDVSEPKQVSAMLDEAEAKAGPVSILINGAAANFVRPSEMLTTVRFRKVIDIVLQGSFNCSIEAGRRMLERGEGTIISLLATYAWTGAPGFLPSAAAKAGVQAMTKTLGVEWIGRGVRVNAVCPGLIDTPQSRERLWPEEWMREELLSSVPGGKFGTERDVTDAVLYLCAPATSYVAGETLVVDSGTSVGGLPYLKFVERAGVVRKSRAK